MPTRPLREMVTRNRLVAASERTTVAMAARLMSEARVGAILVMHGERLTGIFTERDALTRVLAVGLDPVHTRLSEVMTPNPDTMPADKPFGHALIRMYERGYRHMPVMEGRKPIGVVSIRDARPPELDELERDVEQRQHIAELLG